MAAATMPIVRIVLNGGRPLTADPDGVDAGTGIEQKIGAYGQPSGHALNRPARAGSA